MKDLGKNLTLLLGKYKSTYHFGWFCDVQAKF